MNLADSQRAKALQEPDQDHFGPPTSDQCLSEDWRVGQPFVLEQLENFSGFDGGPIGNRDVVPESAMLCKCVALGKVELNRERRALKLTKESSRVGSPAFTTKTERQPAGFAGALPGMQRSVTTHAPG